MSLSETLSSLARPDDGSWRPLLFRARREDDARSLADLLASGRVREVRDTLLLQVAELIETEQPAARLGAAALREAAVLRAGERPEEYGTWAWYPWSGLLVHLLDEAEFVALRSNRNLYEITREEATRLRAARIGIVGLSVGQSAAMTMAQEGVGGTFRIADPDVLGLSNLNRLRAGVHEIGIGKTVLAARAILEIDPYLSVEPFPEGVHRWNTDDFLAGGGALDLVVEECDDLFSKVHVRARARAHGIPVLMRCARSPPTAPRGPARPARLRPGRT